MLVAPAPERLLAAAAEEAISSGTLGFWIVLTTVFMSVSVVTFLYTRRVSYGENMTAKLAREVNLEVPEDLWSSVSHQLMWRLRGSIIGGALGFIGLISIVRPWEPGAGAGVEVSLFGLSLVFLGNQLGAAIGGMLARRRSVGSVRTARLQPISYRQLIAPLWSRLVVLSAVTCVVSAAAFTAVAALLGPVGTGIRADVPLLLAAAITTASLAAALPRIARHFAAARALTGDDHALAWSDALAARTVRDLSIAVIWAGFATTAGAVARAGELFPADAQRAVFQFQSSATVLIILVVLTVLIVVLVTSPDRHLQRTVWPEFALDAALARRDAQ